MLLLLVALVQTPPALAQPAGTATPASGGGWASLSGTAFAPLVTAGALDAPACDDMWIPEGAGTIPYYSAPNGALLGYTSWTPDWEDTPGWHSIEIESPVWIDVAGGWSNGVPTSASNACIPSGSDVVQYGPFGSRFWDWTPNDDRTKTGAAEVGTLQISAGAEVDLTNDANNNQAHLIAFGDIYNAGTITLNNFYGLLSDDGGTIHNTGTITTAPGNGSAYIYGSVDNQGSLNVNGALNLDPDGSGLTFTNTGTITIAQGEALDLAPADATVVFDLDGGTMTNNGTFYQYGGTFEQTAGTITGNSPVVSDADLAPSGGTADILIDDGVDTLTAGVGADQTLTLASSNGGLDAGHLTSALGDLTNAGLIDLTSSANSVSVNEMTNTGTIETVSGGEVGATTLTNTGTLSFGGGALNGNIDNENAFGVSGSTELDAGSADATITNTGAITIAAGQTLSVGVDTFDFDGGTITNGGAFDQAGGTFSHSAGTATGNPLEVDNANLSVSPASGSASISTGGTDTLTTNIGPSETIDVEGLVGNGAASTPTTNAGTFNLGYEGVVNIAQLANTGTVTAAGGRINGLLNNEGGTVSGAATVTAFDQSAGATTIPADDELSVASGVDYIGGTLTDDGTLSAGGSFTLLGGAIANDGSVDLGGGTFQQIAGTISGNPVSINNEFLELTPTSGSVGLEDAYGTSHLLSDIPAADTLTITTVDPGYSIAGVLDAGAFTNAGTIIFEYDGTLHNTGAVTNTGTIDAEGFARIDGGVDNQGTIDAHPFTKGLIAGPGQFELFGSLTQSAAGLLDVTIAPAGEEAEGIYDEQVYVGGTTTLGGALVLEPDTNYVSSAALGDDDYFLTFEGTLNGAFASVTTTPALDGGLTFAVDYTDRSSGFPDVSASVVALPTPADTAPPTIGGVTTQGQVLSETHGSWTGSPTSFSYQWQDCDASGENCTDVAGDGTGGTYTLTAADVGHTLRVVEVASNGAGAGEPATSTATAVVIAAAVGTPPAPTIAVPANSAPPIIAGGAVVGQTLTAGPGAWSNSPTSYTYQWYRCSGAGCLAISGATLQAYTPTSADVGDTLEVAECAHNVAGASAPASSAASAVVASASTATPPPPPRAVLTAKKVSGAAARFSFKAAGRSSGFQCALVRTVTGKGRHTPAPSYAGCVSPKTYRNLRAGRYVFYVRAIGPGGTGSPATYAFTIR